MHEVRSAVGAALVLLVAVVGCGKEAGDRAEQSRAQPDPPRPTVERFSAGVELYEMTIAGDTVIAFNGGPEDEDRDLLRSNDLGATWQRLGVPDAPVSRAYPYTTLGTKDGVGYVTGVEDATPDRYPYVADNAYMWASSDGMSWRGGRLPVQGSVSTIAPPELGVAQEGGVVSGVVTSRDDADGVEMFYSANPRDAWHQAEMDDVVIRGAQTFVGDIWSAEDGRLVAVVLSDSIEDELTILESHDNGRSWQIGTCPDDSVVDGGDCRRPTDTGSLQVGADGVSVNGGDWQTPVLDPPPARGDPDEVQLDDVVELPEGGWLTAASIPVDGGNHLDVLARSDDGVTWRPLLGDDPCLADGRYPLFTTPVRLGAGWLVAHECHAIDHEAPPVTDGVPATTVIWSDMYILNGSATEAVAVPGSRQDGVGYLEPLAVGDVVLVPGRTDGFTEIIRLTP